MEKWNFWNILILITHSLIVFLMATIVIVYEIHDRLLFVLDIAMFVRVLLCEHNVHVKWLDLAVIAKACAMTWDIPERINTHIVNV